MTPSVLVATDLDRTLIYSTRAVERWGAPVGGLLAVERRDSRNMSWMAAPAARTLARLSERAVVVPVTTRTTRQWERIRLPGVPLPFAVTANGGVLLMDGRPDPHWERQVARRLDASAPLSEVWRHLARRCRPEWTSAIRNADGLFCYATVDPERLPDGFVDESAAWAAERGWRVALQGRKFYWLPEPLRKDAAVAEVVRRTGATRRVAAGDSLLDADLLAGADTGIMARHGELVAMGWSAPHVVVTANRGVRAGAEIVDFLAASVNP